MKKGIRTALIFSTLLFCGGFQALASPTCQSLLSEDSNWEIQRRQMELSILSGGTPETFKALDPVELHSGEAYTFQLGLPNANENLKDLVQKIEKSIELKRRRHPNPSGLPLEAKVFLEKENTVLAFSLKFNEEVEVFFLLNEKGSFDVVVDELQDLNWNDWSGWSGWNPRAVELFIKSLTAPAKQASPTPPL